MSKIEYDLDGPVPVARLREAPATDVALFAVNNWRGASNAFLNVAKALIALTATMSTADVKAAFVAQGMPPEKFDVARKNALPAVEVWENVVANGHADEAWFDTLTYHDFRLVRKSLTKVADMPAVGARKLAERGVFAKRIDVAAGELELICNPPPPPPKVKAPAAEATPATPAAPAAPATPVVDVTVTGASSSPAAEAAPAPVMSAETAALTKLDAAEKSILALIDVGDEVAVGRVLQRLQATVLAASAARDARFPVVSTAGLADALKDRVLAAA